ncbi:MAG: hypothetical protein WAL61_15730 [Acidimicrobiales bacterium]
MSDRTFGNLFDAFDRVTFPNTNPKVWSSFDAWIGNATCDGSPASSAFAGGFEALGVMDAVDNGYNAVSLV